MEPAAEFLHLVLILQVPASLGVVAAAASFWPVQMDFVP